MSKARELADVIGTQDTTENVLQGRRNLIINGAMQVAQRGTSATTVSGAGVYQTLDRWKFWDDSDGAYTSEQSTDAPNGFSNSLKLQVTTADTDLGTNNYACIAQLLEAQDLQHLAYGTSDAKDLTLSFWVKSNKTGTYSCIAQKDDNTTYTYPVEYTINTANTWEYKTIVIPGLTASGGEIANDNGKGIRLFWNLAWGSDYNTGTNATWVADGTVYATPNQLNWLDSTSNNFYLTGVQLELGSVATPFEHRSYGEELALCQRYYQQLNGESGFMMGGGRSTALITGTLHLPVEMRAVPSLFTVSGDLDVFSAAETASLTTVTLSNFSNGSSLTVNLSNSGNPFVTRSAYAVVLTDGCTIGIDAEL